MEVELDSQLIGNARCDDLTLLGICALGFAGRHRVIPDDKTLWGQWATQFGPSLADELDCVWELGAQEAAVGRPVRKLKITRSFHSTSLHALRMSPEAGLDLLARPLRILLENGRSDRDFLLAFAKADLRDTLQNAEQRGWLEFETAGGIGELKVRLQNADAQPDHQLLRTVFVCDSDARSPMQPSCDARAVDKGLQELERRFEGRRGDFGCVLLRRACENYAPPSDVCSWARSRYPEGHSVFSALETDAGTDDLCQDPGEPCSPRRHMLAAIALRSLSKRVPQSVDVLDMKNGMKGTDEEVWSTLERFEQVALKDGFGARFSADFFGSQRNLHDHSEHLEPILVNLRERL